ncbi:SpoIID/LytB domain-containing protein [Oculatella sp. LEGE 06141]|nr:SpoIID/LytB domain-containing protein [Oculatella sp. LEGE 06141]MBE9177949.1 SpoIID/LytB domain-containing protein [Oculatella sp. LEGE 06141]
MLIRSMLQRWSGCLAGTALMTVSVASVVPEAATAQTAPLNPTLDVGIVQRFGSNSNDEIVLQPLTGDRLTLKFKTANQEQSVVTSNSVKLNITPQQLAEPVVNERVVLSTHRSFESAEDSANQWKARGVEVELAQPRQWQVWAKRDTYKTPLLRRLLMQNLRSNGSTSAFVDTQVQYQQPKAAFTVNGYRYERDELEITTANSRTQVTFNRDEHGRRLYAGSLRLQTNAYGTYTLVNQVPIETYLRGVVPHEIGLGAPQTTIEAQAVLARTYALRNVRRFAIDNYQLCADTQCQVYRGLEGAAPASDRAITATQGMVLTYQNELVDALYSSTTGGVTAPFSSVWNGPDRPYLKAVVDSVQNVWDLSRDSLADEANFRAFINSRTGFNEEGWNMFRWRVENTLPKIAADLKQYLQNQQHPLANFTTIQQLDVVERSPSGRVQRIAVQTDRGKVELEKDEIMRALYAPNSTLFYLDPIYEPTPNQGTAAPSAQPASVDTAQANPSPSPDPARVLKGYAFVGGGLGHGVGMSQTGAYRLGDLGWSSDRILSFYYPGTRLEPLNSSITFWREPETSDSLATTTKSRLQSKPQAKVQSQEKTTRQPSQPSLIPGLNQALDDKTPLRPRL